MSEVVIAVGVDGLPYFIAFYKISYTCKLLLMLHGTYYNDVTGHI